MFYPILVQVNGNIQNVQCKYIFATILRKAKLNDRTVLFCFCIISRFSFVFSNSHSLTWELPTYGLICGLLFMFYSNITCLTNLFFRFNKTLHLFFMH